MPAAPHSTCFAVEQMTARIAIFNAHRSGLLHRNGRALATTISGSNSAERLARTKQQPSYRFSFSCRLAPASPANSRLVPLTAVSACSNRPARMLESRRSSGRVPVTRRWTARFAPWSRRAVGRKGRRSRSRSVGFRYFAIVVQGLPVSNGRDTRGTRNHCRRPPKRVDVETRVDGPLR
jgi:hypothetical protein